MLDEIWAAPAATLAQQGAQSGQSWPKDGHVSFSEILHALNPLQHLPVIGTIYRAITGDTLPAPMRLLGSIVGGLLTGGPLGVATGILGSFAEQAWTRAREPSPDASPGVPGAPPAQGPPARAAAAYARAADLAPSTPAGQAA